jgi:hypothetical protein
LQSKVSDSTSTTSSTTIASSTAVKSAYDLANAGLPKSGGTVTGNLEIGTTGSLTFEGSTADGFETTLAVVDPTGDRTITLPNISGTVVTTGDTGTVTSTMLLDGTIVNADVNASAAIAGTKIAPDFGSQTVQTTGIVSHALGTALAPTVTFTGDTNTGLYSPGADQVAISTNGTGQVFVDANGRVGIKTASPAAELQVVGNVRVGGAGTSNWANFAVVGDASVQAASPILNFTNAAGNARFAYINQTGVGGELYLLNQEAGPMRFGTSNTERMRLDSSGRLGLGTSSPVDILQIQKTTPVFVIRDSRLGIVNNDDMGGLDWYTSDINLAQFKTASIRAVALQDFQFTNTNATALTFSTAGGGTAPTEKVRIDSSGRVGIGTTSPAYPLDLGTSNDGRARQWIATTSFIGDQGDSTGFQIRALGAGVSGLKFANQANNVEYARIDSSGRLLVGTSTARTNFFNSTVSAELQLETPNATSSVVRNANDVNHAVFILGKSRGSSNVAVNAQDGLGLISFQGNDGTEFVDAARIAAEVDGTPGANDMPGRLVFSVTADGASSPTEALRINNAGELLVGYTTDNGAYKLQVNSQIFATSAIIATSDGRYKENVASLGGCLDLVKALRPVSFTWKPQEDITRIDDEGNEVLVREGHNFPDGTQVGFIAQEVQEVLTDKPWLSSVIKENVRPAVKDNDGNELAPEEQFYGIAEGNLIAVLTNALQEAVGRIEALEAEVAALKS